MSKKSRKKKPAPITSTHLERRRDQVAHRMDSWTSALGGMGTYADKRKYLSFVADGTNWAENIELWRGDDLAGRIVETAPNEMMRQGWDLVIEGDDGKDTADEVKTFLEEYDTDQNLWQALCTEIALGGSGIMIGTNDGDDFSKPLRLDSITKMNFLLTLEPSELQAERWQNDPTRPRFGKPVTYRFAPVSKGGATKTGMSIHESRIAVFPGIQVSRRQVTTQSGWGDAVLTRCRETLRDFQTSWAAAGILVAEFSQAVWKIKGLAEIISLDKDKELEARIRAMELASTTVRAKVLDSEEEWERKQTPISGLPELLDRFATRLAASADMPVTLLMGMSPAGLNATGDSDIRTFYDRIRARQNRKMRPALEKLVRIAFRCLGIEEPENWHIAFRPLWQPTDQEIAQTRYTVAQTDQIYHDMQVLGTDEIRDQRFGGREFSLDIRVKAGTMPELPPTPADETADAEFSDIQKGAQQALAAQRPPKELPAAKEG